MDAILTIVNITAFTFAYTIVLAHHLYRRKLFKAGLFFTLYLAMELCCNFWLTGLNPFTFYISAIAAGCIIGRERSFLYGLHIATTTLMAFQWVIAFLGSLVFLLMPEKNLYFNIYYNLFMAAMVIFAALAMCRWSKFLIKQSASNRLLVIDIAVNLLFIFLINYFLPVFFIAIGTVNYAKICMLLLTTTAVHVLHKNYTFSLEREASNIQQAVEILNVKTKGIVAKYRELFEIKAEYIKAYSEACEYLPLIHNVQIPVVQAALYELLERAIAKNIRFQLYTDSISKVNLNLMDLFTILSIYTKNAALAMDGLKGGQQIAIWVAEAKGTFSFKIETDLPFDTRRLNMYGEEIAKNIAENNKKSSIFINVSCDGKLTQIVEVKEDQR